MVPLRRNCIKIRNWYNGKNPFIALFGDYFFPKQVHNIFVGKKRRFVMLKAIKYIALTLVIIGAINWGLVGAFRFDLVSFLLGDMSIASRIVYILVGLSAIFAVFFTCLTDENCHC